jgi:hypothetical protein
VVVVGAVVVVVFGTVVVVVGAVVVVVGAVVVVVGAVVVVVGAVVVVVGAVVVVVGAVVVVVLVVVVVGVVVVVVLDVVVVVLDVVVVVLDVVVVVLDVVVVVEVTSQWLSVRFDPAVPSFVLADCSCAPSGVNTVKWTAELPPPCFTPDTGLGVIAAGMKEKVISQVGPASGCVRMNSHRCWPAGTVGSCSTVLQLPPVAPLPSQLTSTARAVPASSTSAARIVTTAKPVFVNRRRKRCITALPLATTRGGSVQLGVARGGTLSAPRKPRTDQTTTPVAPTEQWSMRSMNGFVPFGI